MSQVSCQSNEWHRNFTHPSEPLTSTVPKTEEQSPLIQATIHFVQEKLKGNDASHDWHHIERVWTLAKRIAREENMLNQELVELAALLHDIDDWKYSGDEFAGIKAARDFLQTQDVPEERIDFIVRIIKGVGFKEELNSNSEPKEIFPELACVQDADRLDAIGAMGIARCFTYGGHKQRLLYDAEVPPRINLTKEDYMHKSKESTTINHFYEKLFKLKDMMKTSSGKAIAQQRHDFMISFVDQFFAELRGES